MISVNCNNLEAEMKRGNISRLDIAKAIGVSYSTIHSRFNGNSEWLYSECVEIRNKFFPEMDLGYLFKECTDNSGSEEPIAG